MIYLVSPVEHLVRQHNGPLARLDWRGALHAVRIDEDILTVGLPHPPVKWFKRLKLFLY